MRTSGSTFIHQGERDRDLMKAFLSQINSCKRIYLPDILDATVNSPASRFWVTEERALSVIRRIQRGDSLQKMIPTKREMFHEIYRRVSEKMDKCPDLSLKEAVAAVVAGKAPKFYITVGTAKVIIHLIRKKARAKKGQRNR